MINPNLTDFGYSRDNLMAAVLQMGSRKALVRNSPEFCWMCKARGIETIYRNTNDGYVPPVSQAASFAQQVIHGDWAHVLNEVGFSEKHDAFNRAVALELEKLGKRGVFYNTATHASHDDWASAEDTIAWLIGRGHAIGYHMYFDGIHDAGAYEWKYLKEKYGGAWFCTELGYIRTIFDANAGWQGAISPEEYIHRLNIWEVPDESFIFSLEDWPIGSTFGNFAIYKSSVILDGIARYNKEHTVKHSFLYRAKMTLDRVRLRKTPGLSGTTIALLSVGSTIDVYSSDPKQIIDGYTWWWIESDAEWGWIASPIGTKDSFVPVVNIPIQLRSPFDFPAIIAHPFGEIRDYKGYPYPMRHEGLDIVPKDAQCAPIVRACADGTVEKFAFNESGYGNYVKLDHGNGWHTWYSHLAYPAFVCKTGQKVKAGDIIGLMGSTGNSTAPHLHLTVQHEGFGITSDQYVLPDVVDPAPLLNL